MSKLSITALILTYNEDMHLKRCLLSLRDICSDILIVDSYSTDKTEAIAKEFGARFVQNPWTNHAVQINWALKNCDLRTEWVFRVDADEYITSELKQSLIQNLSTVARNINGLSVKRLMYFLDKPLRKGGMYPIWHTRIWRNGKAVCEQRWMDERMVLTEGSIEPIDGDIIDHNLNNISWWTQKHNAYATREAIDTLDQLYNFANRKTVQPKLLGTQEERKRYFKHKYMQLPLFVRPVLYWFYRYIFQGGILEGKRGFIWNFLQGAWYRTLVDVKIFEAYQKTDKSKEALIKYIKEEYGYDV